jgi:predicted Zn-dependent protease
MAAGCASDDLGFYKKGLKQGQETTSETKKGGKDGGDASAYRLTDLAPSHKPDSKSDEAGIWLQVDKIERRVRTAGNRMRRAPLNSYIAKVTCRVAGTYCKDVRVYTLRAPGFNASMYPNGMMHIRSGLLLRVENEAQLAAIIGHEAGHYLRQHSLQKMRDIREKTNSLLFFRIALAGAGVPVVGDIAMLATLSGLSAFSRNREREADGYGLLLLSRAGYDPGEAWKVWQFLVKEKKADKDAETPSFFVASHPPSEERLKTLRDLAAEMRTPKTAYKGRARLAEIVLPIRAGLIRDELHLRKFGPFEALMDRLIERGDNLAELYFFKGEMHRLRNDKDDAQKSLDFYAKAQKAAGTPPPELYRSMGLVHWKLGHRKDARTAFEAYLADNPNAGDREMIKHLMGKPGT